MVINFNVIRNGKLSKSFLSLPKFSSPQELKITKYQPLQADTVELSVSKKIPSRVDNTNSVECGQNLQQRLENNTSQDLTLSNNLKNKIKPIQIKLENATACLTERCAIDSPVDLELIRSLPGYTDKNGEILPYLFVESFFVNDKGKGHGSKALSKIIQLAKDKYGGRLLLKPQNRDRNPSPFYFKNGFLSTTEQGSRELDNYFRHGIPFQSGYSDPMYLPIPC